MAQLKDLLVTGATRILGKVYSPEFVGKLTGNADTATKATSDQGGTNIRTNYALYNGFNFSNNGNGVYLKSTAGTGTIATSATIPAATGSVWGVVTSGTQTFGGEKTFNGLIISATGNNTGIKVGNTYITAINGELIFQNNTSIRFGTSEWDYDKWAGLKYVPGTKTIYLGIPEKSIFTANSAQSGGTLMLPAIRYLSMNGKTVIDAVDSWLRINEGKAFSSGVYFGTNIVRTDGQFQVADSGTKFKADSNGNGYFANNITIAGTCPLTFYGSGNGTYTQGCVYVQNSDGIIIEVPRATESGSGKILALKVRTRGGQPAAEYAGDRLVETDCTYNLGSTTAEFAKGFIRAIAVRHLDADAVYTDDHTLYIGYGNTAYTNKTAFYYSPSLSSRTQFAEINSNGLYALTRFGVNGQNTGYTFYVNGTSYFSGNIYPAGNVYIGPSGAGGYLNGSATNGGCDSIKVGDDVWIGDVNQNGIMGMKSAGNNAGFWFYNSSGTNTGKLYVDSSGNLWSNNNILPLTANTYALGNGSYYWSSTSTQWLHANRANSDSDGGITLYGADAEYGILFRQTSTLGTHGYVTSDWATYFTMSNSANRGWIFRRWGNKNVASIDTDGNTRLSGYLVVDNRSIFNSLVINSSGISVDGDGKYNYCKIATIKISGSYINRPITFEVSGRGRNSSRISIMFQNTKSTDPALGSFTSNWDNCYFIKKTATSTWEVYNQYSEGYGSCRVNRVYGEGYSYGGIAVTWNMENISALPDETTRVSYAGNVNFANSSTNAEYISNENKYMRFHWSGQGGQPSWLWGGNEAGNMYVYNPSNFRVANADTVDDLHASDFLRYKYSNSTIDANGSLIASCFYTVHSVITNGANSNHSVLLNISNIGTPFQIQISDSSDMYLYKRYKSSGSWSGWSKMSAGYADSAGSATNSDKLDGYHESDFLRYSGWWAGDSGQNIDDATGMVFAYNSHGLPGTWGTVTTFEYARGSAYKLQLYGDGANNTLYYRNRSSDMGGWLSWKTIIDSGNIGSQSVNYASSAGNADTVDGQHASAFATAGHTHAYLPIAGGTMTGPLNFANGTYNTVGDDVAIGDINIGGCLGVRGLNGNTNIRLVQYGASTTSGPSTPGVSWTCTGNGTSTISGTLSGTFSGNLSGNASSASSVPWSGITGKPSTFTPSAHNHSLLVTAGDNRSSNTTPNSYANNLIFQGLKTNTKIDSPSGDTYSYVVGLRGWKDSSGGYAHELAFNDSGIFARRGSTTSWNVGWQKIALNRSSVMFPGISLDDNGAYIYGESNSGNILFRFRPSSSADYSYTNVSYLYNNKLGAQNANGYWGMATPNGGSDDWIRTTSNGIIPYQSGGVGGGHGYLGTSSWYFSQAYIDTINAYNINATGYVQANGLINTFSEYQSQRGSRDWRFGSATGNGDQNWFGFYDYTYGFHGGWYGPTHSFRANGEIISTSANAFRAVYGNYGFIIRNDGANTYFMMTNSGDPYGTWNDNYTIFTPNGEWQVKKSQYDGGMPTSRGYVVISDSNADRVYSLSNYNASYLKIRGGLGSYHCTYSNSDIRLKMNVKDSEINALNTINRIKVRQFNWKKDGKHQKIGFIADELEEIDKKFSIGGGYEDKEGKIMDVKSVDTFYLMGYIVKAIQELSEQNLTLKQENDKILKEIELLKSKGESN